VLEIALPFRGDAYRIGIKTPKRELDLVRERLKRLQEIVK
jgi:hypothetical protein